MVAVDTSTLIAYIRGDQGADVDQLDARLTTGDIVVPPVVLSELLSDPTLPARHRAVALRLPMIDVTDGYWMRAAATRARVLAAKHRARLADTLIAQSCIDADVPLITRDSDFRHFARFSGLRLL